MAALVIAVIRHPSIAVVVAIRSKWPFMQPSPKNWPGSKMPTTASLPCSDMTTTLTSTFLNIEDRARHVALRKDNLILAKFKDRLPLANLGEKLLWIKSLIGLACHVRSGLHAETPVLGH